MMYKDRLRELGLISLRNGNLRVNFTAAYNYVMRGRKQSQTLRQSGR